MMATFVIMLVIANQATPVMLFVTAVLTEKAMFPVVNEVTRKTPKFPLLLCIKVVFFKETLTFNPFHTQIVMAEVVESTIIASIEIASITWDDVHPTIIKVDESFAFRKTA